MRDDGESGCCTAKSIQVKVVVQLLLLAIRNSVCRAAAAAAGTAVVLGAVKPGAFVAGRAT